MASVHNQSTNQRYFLKSHTTFGRLGSSVDILVERPEVSKIHALIEWDQEGWFIKDLSSNGTWLNQVKIGRNIATPISQGDIITLASTSGFSLLVDDISAPCDMLVPVFNEQASDNPVSDNHAADSQPDAIFLETYNLLPDDENPEVSLVFNSTLNTWQMEIIGNDSNDNSPKKHPVVDNQVITIAGQTWRLQTNTQYAATAVLNSQQESVTDLHFHFDVSQDEETTKLKLTNQAQSVDLKVRTHHYLALLLARKRIEDQRQGHNEANQGWVYAEQLARDLGIDACHINIQIHRLRKQVSDNLPQLNDLENLIERQSGQLRLGSGHIEIVKGGEPEA